MKDDRYAVPGRIITALHGKNRLDHIGILCSSAAFCRAPCPDAAWNDLSAILHATCGLTEPTVKPPSAP